MVFKWCRTQALAGAIKQTSLMRSGEPFLSRDRAPMWWDIVGLAGYLSDPRLMSRGLLWRAAYF